MAEKEHSRVGPSSASRWMACPGSIRMSEGLPSRAGLAAEKGTRVHELLESCLKAGEGAFPVVEGDVTQDMVEAVQMALEHIKTLWCDHLWFEQRVDLAPMNPPEPMYGHLDVMIYIPFTKTLHIIDLKNGRQVVQADSPQLLYYAAGGLLKIGSHMPVYHIVTTIIQPNAYHPAGHIRSHTFTTAEVMDFVEKKLLPAARATQQPNAPLVPGEHCHFCPAAARCPALAAHASKIAQEEFPVIPSTKLVVTEKGLKIVEHAPPAPHLLPIKVLSEVMTKLPILESWIKSVQEYVQSELEAGREVPGFALADKKAYRKWKDAFDVEGRLADMGFKDEDVFEPPTLKSVAQMEKVVGKKRLKDEMADLIVQNSSGKKVVPSSDSRALLSAADEFTAPETTEAQ